MRHELESMARTLGRLEQQSITAAEERQKIVDRLGKVEVAIASIGAAADNRAARNGAYEAIGRGALKMALAVVAVVGWAFGGAASEKATAVLRHWGWLQ